MIELAPAHRHRIADDEVGPDLIVGYAEGYHVENGSALGELAAGVFSDNQNRWSGDHIMDHRAVPGVLFTNRPLKQPATSLQDLAASLMAEFDVMGFPVEEAPEE